MNRDVVDGKAKVEAGEKTSATKGEDGTDGTAKDRPMRRLVLKAVAEDAANEARRKNLMMGR